MTRTLSPGPPPPSRTATLAHVAWVLAWLIALGGLATDAWLARALPTGLPAIGGTATAPRPLCVVVLDGLRENALWDDPGAMPWLRSFAAGGAGGVAIAGDPTLTAACVRTLLTGRQPDLRIALQNFGAPPVEGSWFQALRALGVRGAHGGDAAIAQMCAPWIDPADVLAFPDRGPIDQGECDAKSQPFVLERARAGYGLLTLHLTGPDHAGHKHGALGEGYLGACARADEQAREVVEAFLARHPDGTVLVAADHGVSPAGTHGGGEAAARRAPFVLRGPGVARRLGLEVNQCALAPTLAVLLGLSQPPLADAPPDSRLLALPAAEVQRALDAHVKARLWVAQTSGAEGVGEIERRRAEVALSRFGAASENELRRLGEEVNRLLQPQGLVLRLGALALALLGVVVFLRGPPEARSGRGLGLLAAAVLLFAAGFALPAMTPLGTVVVAALAALGLAATLVSARRPAGHPPVRASAFPVAVLVAVPAAVAAGVVMFGAAMRGTGGNLALPALLAAAVLIVVAVRTRRAARRNRRPSVDPGALVVCAGAALGLLLSLRPLVDPFLPLHTVVAVGTAVTLAYLWPRRAPHEPATLPSALVPALFGLLLLLPYLATAATNPAGWTQPPPWQVEGWAVAGLTAAFAVLAALPRPWHGRADRAQVGLALAALALAFVERAIGPDPGRTFVVRVALGFGPQVLGLAALALAFRARGSAEGRLAARLIASLALARRLTASDAEFAVVALLALLCALAAHRALPATRRGLAGLAVLMLLVRTAVFHASGSLESFTTVDVGRGFLGLEEWALPSDVGPGGSGVTWPVLVATIQVGVRFAAPWLLLFAAAVHSARESPRLRTVVGDVALAFAARGAVLVLALWALADNAWWVERAKDVYTLACGDVLLLLLATALVGVWRAAGNPRRTESDSTLDPFPAAGCVLGAAPR